MNGLPKEVAGKSNAIKFFPVLLCVCILLIGSLVNVPGITLAQSIQYTFSDITVSFTFGKQVSFKGRVYPTEGIKDIYLFIQPAGEPTRLEKVNFDANGTIDFIYDTSIHPLRSFARTEFWFRVLPVSIEPEKKFESERLYFDYIDNRESWLVLDEGNIRVSWLVGDLEFGQSALNAAKSGLKTAINMLPGQTLSDLKIYIYKDGAKVQEALNSGLASWTAGHASPDLGVVLVSIAPGIDQQLEMDRQIPHEIMHVLLYAMVKENYTRIPMWLNEGLASQAEAYPNQDYQRALTKAAQSKSLIPISALCQEFPQDASSAFLAYAQSSSFVKYLQEKYSTKGLVALVQAYQNGYGCEEGIQSALGIGLEQADHRWQQESLGVDTGTLILQNMMPYLILIILLLAIPLVVIGIAARKPSI